MIPATFKIGPLTFHFYGLMIAAAIYLGWWFAKKRAHLFRIPQKIFDDPILLIPLLLALIGARAYHVIDFWSFYRADPLSIVNIAGGGLGIWGAIAGAIAGFAIVAKARKIDFLSACDLAGPSLLLGQAIGRIANYVNQEGFGPPTNLPWGVYISPDRRPTEFINFSRFHPTFFYEALLNFVFFLILFKMSSKSKFKGQTFAFYLIFYSMARFISEFWRIDTATIGSVKVAHLISVVVFMIGITIFSRQNRKT